MNKYFLYLLFLLIPVINKAGPDKPVSAVGWTGDIYSTLNLAEKGLSNDVFQLAIKGYRKLAANGKLQNSDILTIADFSQSSKNKRLYVIDLKNKALLFNTYVAHGRNTGEEFAKYFSNKAGSCKSSLGFYITRNHATGASVGLSLIIDGVEKGFNDNALKRQIIMHGATYATENFIRRTGRLGRSFGCPSLPPDLIKPVIETIEKGTCLFIYHQDEYYIRHSSLLN
ncbi:MAG: murein L,D-transpeptidase catalytic domain family protein [Bacteroidales bacterium]|nr:murein L,D-transpeptidase catalytic domain family protein [Bacteroidales bacterium]